MVESLNKMDGSSKKDLGFLNIDEQELAISVSDGSLSNKSDLEQMEKTVDGKGGSIHKKASDTKLPIIDSAIRGDSALSKGIAGNFS